MTQYRILNVEPENYSARARAILQGAAKVEELPLTRDELCRQLGDYDVLITRLAHRIDEALLSTGTRLKVVASATTGLDHIDLQAAERRGVAVLSLKGETDFLASIPATAEHTWGLILGLIRKLPAAHGSVLDGTWDRDRFRGHDLRGKTLGIVGYGRIGRQVARFGDAFGMAVRAHDSDPGRITAPAQAVPHFEDLLSDCDVVTLHVPLNDETRGLIGERELALMKPYAVLINTSRGDIIDENALATALEDGGIAGAALDVVHDERAFPAPSTARLMAYARGNTNLILTPHIGGATYESMARTEEFIAEKIAAFLSAFEG